MTNRNQYKFIKDTKPKLNELIEYPEVRVEHLTQKGTSIDQIEFLFNERMADSLNLMSTSFPSNLEEYIFDCT